MSEQNNTRTIVLKVPAFKSRSISRTTYIVALLLFFMPFINIKCNDKSIAKITGKDLLTGYNTKKAVKSPFGDFNGKERTARSERSEKENTSDEEDIIANDKDFKHITKPSPYAIVAVLLCLVGIIFSFIRIKMAGVISAIAGAISCLMLVVIFFSMYPQMNEIDSGGGGLGFSMSLSISFSFWFYLCAVLLGIGAYFSFQVYREIAGRENAERMQEYARQFNYDPVNLDEKLKEE